MQDLRVMHGGLCSIGCFNDVQGWEVGENRRSERLGLRGGWQQLGRKDGGLKLGDGRGLEAACRRILVSPIAALAAQCSDLSQFLQELRPLCTFWSCLCCAATCDHLSAASSRLPCVLFLPLWYFSAAPQLAYANTPWLIIPARGIPASPWNSERAVARM